MGLWVVNYRIKGSNDLSDGVVNCDSLSSELCESLSSELYGSLGSRLHESLMFVCAHPLFSCADYHGYE